MFSSFPLVDNTRDTGYVTNQLQYRQYHSTFVDFFIDLPSVLDPKRGRIFSMPYCRTQCKIGWLDRFSVGASDPVGETNEGVCLWEEVSYKGGLLWRSLPDWC